MRSWNIIDDAAIIFISMKYYADENITPTCESHFAGYWCTLRWLFRPTSYRWWLISSSFDGADWAAFDADVRNIFSHRGRWLISPMCRRVDAADDAWPMWLMMYADDDDVVRFIFWCDGPYCSLIAKAWWLFSKTFRCRDWLIDADISWWPFMYEMIMSWWVAISDYANIISSIFRHLAAESFRTVRFLHFHTAADWCDDAVADFLPPIISDDYASSVDDDFLFFFDYFFSISM